MIRKDQIDILIELAGERSGSSCYIYFLEMIFLYIYISKYIFIFTYIHYGDVECTNTFTMLLFSKDTLRTTVWTLLC